MALVNWQNVIDAENNGQFLWTTWRKTPTQTTGAGIWFDLSMSPGNPVPNYYAASPTISIALAQSTDGGIYHGGNLAPLGKKLYLKTFMSLTTTAAAVPLPMILCDYLMYYPFMDMSITGPQSTTSSIALPRYAGGAGVQMIAVVVAAPSGAGNPVFQVTYTNSAGVSGQVTPAVACNTQVVNGTLANSQPTNVAGNRGTTGPFIQLAPGDTGIRTIDSVNFLTPDVGLITFVLVKPLMNTMIRTIDAPAERVTIMDANTFPVIQDDAFLNLLCMPNGSLSGAPIHGYMQTIWM